MSTLLSTNFAHGFVQSFVWSANTESDLAGYYIYYKNGSSGIPYDGTGAVEGNSPIQIPLANLTDPANPEYTLHGLDDTGTFYFVATAYNNSGLESLYSNELCHGTSCIVSEQGEGRSGGGGCFIATAAFGSKFEKHVQILHRFRDIYLMPNQIGRTFVKYYYRYSPPVANFIAGHNRLCMFVRWSLMPIIGLSWILLHFGVIPTLIFFVLMSAAVWLRTKKSKFVGQHQISNITKTVFFQFVLWLIGYTWEQIKGNGNR